MENVTQEIFKCRCCQGLVYGKVMSEANGYSETAQVALGRISPLPIFHQCPSVKGSLFQCDWIGVVYLVAGAKPGDMVRPVRWQVLVANNLTDPSRPIFEIWRCRKEGEARQAPTMISSAIVADSFIAACRMAFGAGFDPNYVEGNDGIPYYDGCRLYPSAAEAAAGVE
jgi:hypothetical protein